MPLAAAITRASITLRFDARDYEQSTGQELTDERLLQLGAQVNADATGMYGYEAWVTERRRGGRVATVRLLINPAGYQAESELPLTFARLDAYARQAAQDAGRLAGFQTAKATLGR